MLAGNGHLFNKVNKEIAEDEARYLQADGGFFSCLMCEYPAWYSLAGRMESLPISFQIEPTQE
jgi:hypothetical protein